MPLVSATDVPLQPYPTGRTSPAAPDAYERIQTSPSMFGSIQAEALEKAGAQGEKLATEVAKIGAYQQHYLNLAEKDKLAVELGDAQNARVYGDPTAGLDANGQPLVPGFKNRYGSDAIDYIRSGQPRKDFQSDIDRIAASASNPMVKQAFLREANTRRMAFDNALAEHFNSQLNTHNDQIQKAKSASADRDASYGYNDDNALIDSMNKGREAVAASLGNETDPNIVNSAFAASDAARVGAAIDSALANNNPERAKELLDKWSAGPNPTLPGKLAEHYYSRIQPKLDEKAANRAQAAVGQGARAAAAAYAEDSRIIGEIDKAVQTAQDASRDKDPTVLAYIRSKVRTELGTSALNAAIANENTGRAQRLLQTFSDTMTGEQLQKYHGEISKLLEKEVAARAAGRGPGGEPLVPHTPAPDTLGAIGFTPAQYQTFRNHVAERESGSYAQPPNAGGYMGRFQMGRQEIRETAERLGVPVPTQQQFLGDPQLQERFFENYTLDHHLSLMEQSATYRNASPAERAGILMGAHLGGVQGVLRYLNSGGRDDPADSNGTRVSSYVTSMRQRFAVGGSMPPMPPSQLTPYAPGTTTPPPAPAAPAPGTPAPPAPAPAAPARQAGTGPIEVWGDSLGVGLKGALKSEGHAVGGQSPSAILADIRSQPADYWNGKLIALASGSNRNEMDKVEETVKYLQSKNADVALVGYGPVFSEKNAKLREIAQRLNVPVIDAEGFGPRDGVHPGPQGYLSMAGRIRALRSAPIVVPRPDPNARPPAGMVAPGNMTPPNFAPTP